MARAVASSFLVGDSSLAARTGAPGAAATAGPLWGEAEYPARSTAVQMSSSVRTLSSKSTVIEPESRLTATPSTPSSLCTAFSTWA